MNEQVLTLGEAFLLAGWTLAALVIGFILGKFLAFKKKGVE